jgi:hypothetical protein
MLPHTLQNYVWQVLKKQAEVLYDRFVVREKYCVRSCTTDWLGEKIMRKTSRTSLPNDTWQESLACQMCKMEGPL